VGRLGFSSWVTASYSYNSGELTGALKLQVMHFGSKGTEFADRHQNVISWCLGHTLALYKMSSKSDDKTKEIVITASRMRAPPPPRPDVERVSSLRILGVTVNDKLTAVDHVTTLLSSSSSLMYAM